MKVLTAYISNLFIRNFVFALLGLSALFIFQSLINYLMDTEYTAQQSLIYHALKIPEVLVQMAPPAALTGTVVTLSSLTRTNELVACYSIGVGLQKIVVILVSLVFMISCLCLVFQDRILPPFFKKHTTFYWKEMKGRADVLLDFKQDKIWYRSGNLIYNLQSFDRQTQTIIGMAVYTFDEGFNLIQVVEAKKATYSELESKKGWELFDGSVTILNTEDSFPLTKRFKTKALPLQEKPSDFQEIEKEVDGLRLKELYRFIKRTEESGVDTRNYEVKLHSRISLSFIPIIMCFLGIPFSVRLRREGGIGRDLGICLGLTFFYWLFYNVGLSMGTSGILPPVVAAWFPSLVFGVAAGVMIYRKRS